MDWNEIVPSPAFRRRIDFHEDLTLYPRSVRKKR